MNLKQIKNISIDNFKKYGDVLDFPKDSKEAFEIIVRVPDSGWRLALLRFSDKTTKKLENHPTSKESFEPLSGTALLIVAENKTPADFEIFLLDKPVCLDAGVWHQVISLSEKSVVKIAENNEVGSEFFEPENEISAQVIC